MRVGIYCRTSKQEGKDAGSIPVQLANCRDYAAEMGWDVVVEHQDGGITGWRRKVRPGYEELFADAAAGRIDAVLCRDYDRLLRNDKEGQRWLDLYATRKFRHFKFADEADIDLNRARDRKDWRERVAAAIYYSDRLSEKIKRTKQAQMAEGKYTGGERHPFGYARVGGHLQVDVAQAALIHEAVFRLTRGDSVYRIVVDWNDAGITTANGARWRPRGLRRMLTSGHLTGEKGFPQILTPEEAALARTALTNTEVAPRGRPSGRKYVAVGIVYCGVCDTKLAAWSGAYKCSPSSGGGGHVSIKAAPFEAHLYTQAVLHLSPSTEPVVIPTAVDTDALLDELNGVEEEIEETRRLVGDSTLRVADAAPILRDLAQRTTALTDEIARALPPATNEFTGPAPYDYLDIFGPLTRGGGEHLPHPDFVDRLNRRALTEAEVLHMRDEVLAKIKRVVVQRGTGLSRVQIVWREGVEPG